MIQQVTEIKAKVLTRVHALIRPNKQGAFVLRHRVRGAALIALVALLFQTLVPLFHVPPRGFRAEDIALSAITALCHASPGVTDDSTDQKRNRSAPAPANNAPDCPICFSLQIAGTFLSPTPVAIEPVSSLASERLVEKPKTLNPTSFRISARPRAPPRLHDIAMF